MKRNLFLCFLLTLMLSGFTSLKAQNPADRILGKWYTEENKSLVEVYKQGDQYFGKMIWLKTPNREDGSAKLDDKNPDTELQKRPLLGLVILSDLEFDEDNEWEDGKIYDPESGNTYSCYIELIDHNTIHMRGYIGFSLFGRTTTWIRKTE